MKIYAPVKNATGVWCSVHFTNGVGETNKPHLIEWFKNHGYRVEKCDKCSENHVEKRDIAEEILNEIVDNVETTEPVDLDTMTPNQLREWMKSNGYGSQIKNIRDKEKLLNIVRG